MNKHQVCAAGGLTFEDASSIIGGTASFMLGGIFLIAGSSVGTGHSWGTDFRPRKVANYNVFFDGFFILTNDGGWSKGI
jgi:hypothetical protein